jgi:pimeloyl-ACP methyl ester carboxylesterase
MNATSVPTGTVLVDELRIRYADSGADGPVILLTSPWPESLLAFRRVWPALARTARLVSLDLPGFGHSEGRADVFTPSAMGEFLIRFIAECKLGNRTWSRPTWAPAPPCSWPRGTRTRSGASWSAAARQPFRWR